MGTAAAVAAVVSALAGVATTVRGMTSGGGGGGRLPSPQQMDTTAMSRALLPGAKADAAARLGGGISPEFLAGLIGQEGGQAGMGLDILGEIRQSLGGIQAP